DIQTSFDTVAPRGSIYRAVQDMSQSLATMVTNLEKSMHALRAELSAVEARSNTIADLTVSQQQSTAMIATAMTEMASSANHVANSASDTANNTDEADKQSQHTQKLIHNTVENIQGLASQLNTASKAVADLDQDVNNIVKVLDVIGDIAEQTNLLALNAAIEAARAGEQGRGFAVVADEVRALAGRTQQATVEIQTMIESLQRNSQSLTKLMEVTVNNANEGQNLMTEVNHEIGSLADKNQTISDSSIQIATAAEEQGVVADNIASSVEEIRVQADNVCNMISTTSQNVDQLR
ncbi:methyl-accepting chemotaxis protein, partial [Vibrio parahaemolyticus]|nr:methyl-accepting chemotaxis protein [Vibrio parahaemolyticus]